MRRRRGPRPHPSRVTLAHDDPDCCRSRTRNWDGLRSVATCVFAGQQALGRVVLPSRRRGFKSRREHQISSDQHRRLHGHPPVGPSTPLRLRGHRRHRLVRPIRIDSAERGYVAMSRGRVTNRIYATQDLAWIDVIGDPRGPPRLPRRRPGPEDRRQLVGPLAPRQHRRPHRPDVTPGRRRPRRARSATT